MKKIISFLGTKIGISIIASFILILTAGLFRYTDLFKFKEKSQNELDIAIGKVAEKILDREEESKKFKTWQELYGSSTQAVATSTKTIATSTVKTYTSTELFAQEIFKQYLKTKKQGGEIDEDTSNAIASDVLSGSYPTDEPENTTLSDLKIISTNNISLQNYVNSLYPILNTPLIKDKRGKEITEIEVLYETIGRPELLESADFKPFLERYKEIREKLVKLHIPDEVSIGHIQLVNAFNKLVHAVEGMINLQNDPIGSIGKIGTYSETLILLEESMKDIRSVMDSRGIYFSTNI